MYRLLLAALLLAPLPAASKEAAKPVPIWFELDHQITAAAREAGCAVLKKVSPYTCPSLAVPLVVLVAELPPDMMGAYIRGGTVVYLSGGLADLDHPETQGVLIHEIIHWAIHWKSAPVDMCENERISWAGYDLWMDVQNRPDLKANNEWIKRYPQCLAAR